MSRGKAIWIRKTNSFPKVWHPYGCQVLRKLYISNGKGEKNMKCYEVRFTNMTTTVVYAKSEKSAMKTAEAITYLIAVTARKLDGNSKG